MIIFFALPLFLGFPEEVKKENPAISIIIVQSKTATIKRK